MATSLLYLGSYFILVTAGSGGIYIYSCYSYYSCCGVIRAAIKVTSSTVIGITCSAAIKIAGGISRTASGIGRTASKISGGFYRYCYGLSRDTPVTPYTRLPISTATFITPDLQYPQYP